MVFDIILSESLKEKAEKIGFNPIVLDKKLIIKTDNRNDLIRKVSSFHSKGIPIIVLGSTDEINRMVLEDKRASMLINPEEKKTKDFMKWRNSGLNHVLCRFASENNIKIGINASSLLKSKDPARFGRIMQNIRLCRKYNTKIVLASFAESESGLLSVQELRSIGITLGMTPEQANKSLENASELLK